MKNRTLLVILSVLVALVLISSACSAGFVAGNIFNKEATATLTETILPSLTSTIKEKVEQQVESTSEAQLSQSNGNLDTEPAQESDNPEPTAKPISREELFKPFWQAWDLVHEQFVDQPVDDVALMRGAIKGMMEALDDQHTSYLDPVQFKESNDRLQGEEYDGIGAWVDVTGEYLTIISPMPGSPAEKAGLKPGDQVIAIDGEDMTGLDGMTARSKVLGPSGTVVTLTIQREGIEEPFDVVVERAKIIVPSVDAKMLENDIAYVRLLTFGDDTSADLRKALEELLAQNPKGLILDLRYNGGGYLDTAIDVSSEFIKDGVVMYEQFGDGSRRTFESKGNGIATDIPMVVLINEGSASASEIVAGAIQDRGRGQLVGVTSFGKGSVQVYTELDDNQGAVRITIARWLTPNERTIHEQGLTPDVEVEITEEDVAQDLDPQLDKAIELLLGAQ
jgi:carboxyl-terminal processing protease